MDKKDTTVEVEQPDTVKSATTVSKEAKTKKDVEETNSETDANKTETSDEIMPTRNGQIEPEPTENVEESDKSTDPVEKSNVKNSTAESKSELNDTPEVNDKSKDNDESLEDDNTAESEKSEEKPVENEKTEKVDTPKDTLEDKPVEHDKVEETPMRATRGTKRKAVDSEKDESTNDSTSSETTEQKENVNSKYSDNVENEDDAKDDTTLKSLSGSGNIMGKGKRARIPNKRYSDILLSPNRKSGGPPKSLENTELEVSVKVKEEPVDPAFVSTVSSPSLPPKKNRASLPKENLQDPKFLKPFKYGWKRELVWRSTSTNSKRLGDIYYYTPSGKKVRSFREVSDHLHNKNLSLENFSFCKEPLGVDDPQKEIIRDAKIAKSSDSFSESPAPKKLEIKKPKKVLSPKSGGADTSKVVETPVVTTTPGRRRAAASGVASLVEKQKEKVKQTPPSATKKILKMPLKKGKTPPAKKLKLSVKTEEPMEVESTPPPARPAPGKTRASQNAQTVVTQTPPKLKKRNLKLKSITHVTSAGPEEKNETKFMENYLQNLSFGYNTLLYVFQYLKVQDLLRAGCVCTMWRDIASHPILWRTVRMKNSQVHSFEGLANTLKKHGTVHLDLRKMLLPSNGDDIWPEFSKAIEMVDTLRKIELCRCPATVVEQLAVSNPNLEVINAVTIKCDSMNLDAFSSLKCIRELRLKSTSGLNINSIDSLKQLKTLKILSLTSVNDLHKLDLSVIAELTNLESLDLGECSDFPKNFGQNILLKLGKLEKLRLEKGQGNCHTFEILKAVKEMKSLEQLELVNFDVKAGFDKAIGSCMNIRKLMIIPTYISQSATTNNMVLAGVLRLQGSLTHFVWGVTLELLRVTELFVDQCEDSNKKDKKPTGNGDSIPVLKPVPDLSNGGAIQSASNPPQVEILPLPNLQKLLLNSLPTTRVKILKIPFHATWRQTLTDSV